MLSVPQCIPLHPPCPKKGVFHKVWEMSELAHYKEVNELHIPKLTDRGKLHAYSQAILTRLETAHCSRLFGEHYTG